MGTVGQGYSGGLKFRAQKERFSGCRELRQLEICLEKLDATKIMRHTPNLLDDIITGNI
jgi:hypothetical protein